MIRTRKILIYTTDTIEFVDIKNIVSIRALDNYSQVFLHDGRSIVSTITFGKLSYMLGEHGFFQCHKSFTINLSAIRRYHKCGDIEMVDSSLIPLARRRKDDFDDLISERSLQMT